MQLNPERRKAILLALTKLRDDGPARARYGICFNLNELVRRDDVCGYAIVEHYSPTWKHYSGSSAYPIQAPWANGLWEGKQKEARLSLINHMIVMIRLDITTDID